MNLTEPIAQESALTSFVQRPQCLSQSDVDGHVKLGIEVSVLYEMEVRRVDDYEVKESLAIRRHGSYAGILYPYFLPGQLRAVTHRLRRDNPDIEAGQPKNKYISGYGDHRHLYFATRLTASLSDVSVPVVLVEAEKSALSVRCAAESLGRPVLAIGVGGCWGWRGRIGKTVNVNGCPGRRDGAVQ